MAADPLQNLSGPGKPLKAEPPDAAETAGVKVMKLNVSDLKRYLRIVGTIAGTTPSFDFGVEFVGITKAG